MVLNELEAGLKHHSLINSEEVRKHYKHLLSVVKEEYEDIVKNEVQRAIAADEDALTRLCGNYIDNVKAYTQREKVNNKYAGQTEEQVDSSRVRFVRAGQMLFDQLEISVREAAAQKRGKPGKRRST